MMPEQAEQLYLLRAVQVPLFSASLLYFLFQLHKLTFQSL
jgi:hypothetical protein